MNPDDLPLDSIRAVAVGIRIRIETVELGRQSDLDVGGVVPGGVAATELLLSDVQHGFAVLDVDYSEGEKTSR
jgi:hypothetical protein